MTKKIVTLGGTSITGSTVYYTCPSNTVTKMISYNNEGSRSAKVFNSGGVVSEFSSSQTNRGSSPHRTVHMIAAEFIKFHDSASEEWNMVLVEETTGDQ